MKDMEIVIAQDGAIQAVYRDADTWFRALGPTEIKRASNVEWETDKSMAGWTVRSAADPELALRWHLDSSDPIHVAREGELARWLTREDALAAEIKHFWALAAP